MTFLLLQVDDELLEAFARTVRPCETLETEIARSMRQTVQLHERRSNSAWSADVKPREITNRSGMIS